MEKRITLPILPHLKKWLVRKYEIDEVFEVNSSTTVGITLLGLVALRTFPQTANDKYTESIVLEFGTKISEREIRQAFVIGANTYFDRLFKEDMITFIEALRRQGVPAYRSTELFLDLFDIEEGELQKNSAYRHYMRHNERLREKKNRPKCHNLQTNLS